MRALCCDPLRHVLGLELAGCHAVLLIHVVALELPPLAENDTTLSHNLNFVVQDGLAKGLVCEPDLALEEGLAQALVSPVSPDHTGPACLTEGRGTTLELSEGFVEISTGFA